MKKKGLIIATIVMVLVLAVSLTTATYAWFSATGVAKVSDISFAVAQSTDVLIGVKANNTLNMSENTSSHFYSDTTEWTGVTASTGTWLGTTNGLGLSVELPLDLTSCSAAVYSETGGTYENDKYTAITADPYDTSSTSGIQTANTASALTQGINMSHTIFKANGNGTSITTDTATHATIQSDYLDVVFGVQAGKSSIRGYGCLVWIDKTDSLDSIGILSGIHVGYQLDNGTFTEKDAYGTYGYTTSVSANTTNAPTAPSITITGTAAGTYTYSLGKDYSGGGAGTVITAAKGDAFVWIPIEESTDSTYVSQDIHQLRLVVYLCGPDEDTITAAKGNTATIRIQFLAINSDQVAD